MRDLEPKKGFLWLVLVQEKGWVFQGIGTTSGSHEVQRVLRGQHGDWSCAAQVALQGIVGNQG